MHEAPTVDSFLTVVMDRVPCGKHKMPLGIPCWHIHAGNSSTITAAVCNSRAVKAGFVGQISPAARRQREKTHDKRQ